MIVDCPSCGRPLSLIVRGVLFGDQSRIEVTLHPFSARVHAKCFGSPHGGQPVSLPRAA